MSWDRTEPAASSYLQSADIRSGWEALDEGLHAVNLLADPTYLIWPAGDAADPAHWVSSGAGVTIGREVTIVKAGVTSAQLTYAAATVYLDQDILPAGDYDDYFDGKDFSFGAWIWSDSIDAKIGIDDGSDNSYSDTHAGDSAWEWLTGTHTIDASATEINFRHKLAAAGDLYSSWPTVIKGSIPPMEPFWPRVIRGSLSTTLAGDPLGTGTELWAGTLGRPFIVQDVQIEAISDNSVDQAMILDVNQWNGSAWVSMFSTKPEIAANVRSGGEQPDGTYQMRCFKAGFGTTNAFARIGIDCDQAAVSGAKNPTVFIRALQFQRPQEILLGFDSVQ